MTTKKKIVIHVARKEHIVNGKVFGLSYGLDALKISYTCIVDLPLRNRKYPYITVDDQVKCIKCIMKMAQRGKL